MSRLFDRLRSFLTELKRRNVYRVAATYAVVAFVGFQTAKLLIPSTVLPPWTDEFFLFLLIIGFPVAVVVAWAFELTPEGVRRTPEAEQPGNETGPSHDGRARSSLAMRALLGFGLLAMVGTGGWLLFAEPSGIGSNGTSGATSSRIAVFPFSFRGGEDFAYLGKGMVDLLSTKLEGAGELRSVDPPALLAALRRGGADRDPPDPEQARELTRRFGAGLYILGNIVEVGGRVEVDASLYELGHDANPVGRAQAEGAAEELFEVVDRLAADLLGDLPDRPGGRIAKTAAVTTHSLPALKAYLEGEQEFRAGDFQAALEAFQEAVRIDSAFALAHYRLSIAAEWNLSPANLITRAAERAARYGDRLSQRDRQLLDAFLATRRGDASSAERLYRGVVTTHPEDIEAWFQLGEVLFHFSPIRGGSIADSRSAWERVVELEPNNAGALIHLTRIAAATGRWERLDSLAARVLELNPSGDRILEVRALRAFTTGDSTMRRRVLATAAGEAVSFLPVSIWSVAAFTENLPGALALSRVLARNAPSAEERGLGYLWAAQLELAQGRRLAAFEDLDRAASLIPSLALEQRALGVAAPFLDVSETELRAVRQALTAWNPDTVTASAVPSVWLTAHEDVHPLLRHYLLGLVEVRLGREEEALVQVGKLTNRASQVADSSLARDLALGLRAEVAAAEGRVAEARAALERTRREAWYNLHHASAFYAQTHTRLRWAQMLETTGRTEEALRWYRSFRQNSVYDLTYLAPALERQAEILVRQGRTEEAAATFRQFIAAWKDADEPLQERVQEARKRLRELTSSEDVETDE